MTNSQLWFRGVRSSKFRHVYGEPSKREKCYDNIKVTKNAHDSQFCAVNPKFLAIVTEVAGGGAFLVLPIEHTGRLDFNAYRVTGHRGPVLDIKWNPFNDNLIASCSDDCTIKLWHIPDGGLSMHLTEWLIELQGHKRRVAYIEWHPTAENIIFSVGFDHLVIVWHIGRGEAVNVIDCHSDVIYSMSLNRDGSLLATTSKDKKLRIIEPRTGIVKSEGVCHAGSKASKVTFLGSSGRLLTTGFSRHSDRQYAVWDQHDLNRPLFIDTIDSSSGVVFPFYDYDTNIVYLAGKGDGNIRYYEVVNEAPWIHFLNQFLSGNPQRGLGFMPKRGCNVNHCEIFRFFKLHATRGMCEPISMIVPRKSDQFHDDLYPDTAAPMPALTADEWISGRNAPPVLMSLKTGVNITTYKPHMYKAPTQTLQAIDNNNKKKFAFLSVETIPDYRPRDMLPHNEKSQKTSSNQTTKFHQLQQMFGNIPINNEPNNENIPLYKQIASANDHLNENEFKRKSFPIDRRMYKQFNEQTDYIGIDRLVDNKTFDTKKFDDEDKTHNHNVKNFKSRISTGNIQNIMDITKEQPKFKIDDGSINNDTDGNYNSNNENIIDIDRINEDTLENDRKTVDNTVSDKINRFNQIYEELKYPPHFIRQSRKTSSDRKIKYNRINDESKEHLLKQTNRIINTSEKLVDNKSENDKTSRYNGNNDEFSTQPKLLKRSSDTVCDKIIDEKIVVERNIVIDTVNHFNDDSELRRAYNRQVEELQILRKQLANSEQRVKELEETLTKLITKYHSLIRRLRKYFKHKKYK